MKTKWKQNENEMKTKWKRNEKEMKKKWKRNEKRKKNERKPNEKKGENDGTNQVEQVQDLLNTPQQKAKNNLDPKQSKQTTN